MDANPLDRGHQDKLTCFTQETLEILDNLGRQKDILDGIQVTEGYRTWEVKRLAEDQIDIHPKLTSRSRSHARPVYYTQGPSKPEPRSSYFRPAAYYDRNYDNTRNDKMMIINNCENDYENPALARTSQISNPRMSSSQLDPIDPSGVQGLLIQNSRAVIEKKIREFEEMNTRATELGIEVYFIS